MSQTFTLFTKPINNEQKLYTAEVFQSNYDPSTLKVAFHPVRQFGSKNIEDVINFLSGQGVVKAEILVAVETMEKQDHNYAEFGAFGSFTFSTYKGFLH